MVTLVGPGGVGKTRLATETALEVASRFPDGVWFCDLAAVVEDEAVPAVVADTIGARHQAGMDLTEAITEVYLQRRRCLVVLDNCEHVLEAVVHLARRLLALEAVAVLATSREVLRLQDEQRWPVPPLPESAAMDLSSTDAGNATPTSHSTQTPPKRSARSAAALTASPWRSNSRPAGRRHCHPR